MGSIGLLSAFAMGHLQAIRFNRSSYPACLKLQYIVCTNTPVYLQQLDSRVNILFVSLYSECFSASSVRTDLTDSLFCFELSEFQETNSFVDSLWEAIMKTTRKKARTARFLQIIFDSLNLNLSTLHLFFLSLDWLTSTCSTVGITNQCLLTYFH